MQTIRHVLGAVSAVAVVLGIPLAAAAQDGALYDWSSERAPVLITNDTGVLFIGKNREVRRAYAWERESHEEKRGLFLPDLDQDGDYEVVGAGDPTFALKNNSNPMWNLSKGCEQVIVADYALDDKLDIMCNRGTTITIYTWDRQKVWSLDPGVRIDFCRSGDINGDLKMDIECKFARGDKWFRVDSSGKISSKSAEEPEIPKDAIDLDEATPVPKKVWTGKREWDLNGDGAVEESITADGSAIVIQSRSKKSAVARADLGDEVVAAMVKNLDGEKRPEIVALTDSEVVVLNAKAEVLGRYPADADAYRRRPVAKFDSVYARKFSDDKKAAKKIRGAKKDFAKCYEDQVRGDLVVGIGQIILKGYVGAEGEMTNIELMHSAINNRDVQQCAQDVLRGLDYPKPASADDEKNDTKATVNVVLKFSFQDRP